MDGFKLEMLENGARLELFEHKLFFFSIIQFVYQTGALKIIDRVKNFFKLSQGEYIAAEKLEVAYARSEFISQIMVYGDSSRSYLIAFIVPDKSCLDFWCLTNGIRLNYYDQCKNKVRLTFQEQKSCIFFI